MENRREVKPARLLRFPRFAICPYCGNGGEGNTKVASYVDRGMPANGHRYVMCGYCSYDGPALNHPLYPKPGKNN